MAARNDPFDFERLFLENRLEKLTGKMGWDIIRYVNGSDGLDHFSLSA